MPVEGGEFEHFALHSFAKTMHADDAVGQHDNGAFGARLRVCFEIFNSILDQCADFRRIQ